MASGCGRTAHDAARTVALSAPPRVPERVGQHIPSKTGQESLTYTVQVDAGLTHLDVQLCPSGFRIERLNAPSPGARAFLDGAKVITPQGDYAVSGEGVDLESTESDACVRYAVNLPNQAEDPSGARRVGEDVLASPDLWLWVPTPRPEGVRLRAHFDLPEGVLAMLPWQQEPTGDFVLPETAFAWKSAGAFGHRAPDRIAVPGGELSVATLGAGFGAGNAAVRAWLEQGATTSRLLFGRFPVARTLVLLVPTERSGPAFGMALRGGGAATLIFLDQRTTAKSLETDWTATHEFLHLGVPRLPPEDAWFFEGLATYYTEITRARAGLISAEQAYQHLLEGFARGRKQGGTLTLRKESAAMRERRSFYRVYWAGAAIAFLTDVGLRRARSTTLDAALRAFAECCAASDGDATAATVLAQLEAYGAGAFTNEAARWLDRSDFPALDETLRSLGVGLGKNGAALFRPAPHSPIRDAIMARAR